MSARDIPVTLLRAEAGCRHRVSVHASPHMGCIVSHANDRPFILGRADYNATSAGDLNNSILHYLMAAHNAAPVFL